MRKRKTYLIAGIIFILAFFAANLSEPKYLNQGIDFLNSKLSFHLPLFWQVPFKLGLDLQGGVHLVYQADLSNIKKEDYNSSMQGLRDVIERRVNLFGVREPVVQVQGERLIIELAGVKDISEAIKQIGQTPYLEFKQPKGNYQEILEGNQKFWETGEGQYEDPYEPTPLTGKYLKKAELGFDQTTYQPLVFLQFNEEGAKIFEDLTSRYTGKPLAIYIDQMPISTPVVQEKISGGKAQITGKFTADEAKKMVRSLNAGALPVPIKLISQQSVGPILGKVSLDDSLRAGIFGFLAVLLFMILFYRVPGFLASLSLVIYVVFLLALFKLISVTLTLAGIAGFLLSMGMAVDANVLIFERQKEERKGGETFQKVLENGFTRAWPSIRDSNLTTLLIALIMFSFGSSFVKGFAFTLSLGVLTSMFSAIIVTRTLMRVFKGTRLEKIKKLWA